MNRKQIQYLAGITIGENPDLMFAGLALGTTYEMVNQFSSGHGISGLMFGFLSFECSRILPRMVAARINYLSLRKGILELPFENVEEVNIQASSLDGLLEKTWYHEKDEWGTVLRADHTPYQAIIKEILDPIEAKNQGLVYGENHYSTRFNFREIQRRGYNGFHHYHPGINAMSFSVNLIDKSKCANAINLLTFNLPEGPEIIAFNRRFVYIAADQSKRQLVKATSGQIMEYLKHPLPYRKRSF